MIVGNNTGTQSVAQTLATPVAVNAPSLPPAMNKLKDAFLSRNDLPSKITILLYGEALSGKTSKLWDLAKAGYTVYLINLDNQAMSLLGSADRDVVDGVITQEQADEALGNIIVFNIADSVAIPNAAVAMNSLMEFGTFNSCADHNMHNCPLCTNVQGKEIYTFDLKTTVDRSFVVIDSLTALSKSELIFAKKKHGINFTDKADWDSFGVQGSVLDGLLTMIKSATHNWIVISHAEKLKQQDGTQRTAPIGGTRNWAINLPRAFQATLFSTKVGGFFKLICDPLDTQAVSGDRYGMRLQDQEGNSTLLPYVDALAKKQLIEAMVVVKSQPKPAGGLGGG